MMRAAVIALGLGLFGCATASLDNPSDVGPYPANYREIVAANIKADFIDPLSLKDVWISKPFPGQLYLNGGWMVCLHANGKNRSGIYVGRQDFGYLIYEGAIVRKGLQRGCLTAQYAEWTEMEMASKKH